MTRLWPSLVVVALLSSCISVDDFGTYWDKGFVDPTLSGTWQKLDSPSAGTVPGSSPAVWTFTRKDTSYSARAMNPVARGKVETRQFTARSLRVGDAVFLMLRDPEGKTGAIARYEFQGSTLRAYRLDGAAARLEKIGTLDDEAVRALAKTVEDSGFWHVQGEYARLGAGIGGSPGADGPAVLPGSSLPPADRPQQQAVTLFDVTQAREVGDKFFIAGVGYVAINGGGSVLAGMNRALDPFIELTISSRNDPVFTPCRSMLSPSEANKTAIRITGLGHYERRSGVNDRFLVIVLLDKLTDCRVVDRR